MRLLYDMPIGRKLLVIIMVTSGIVLLLSGVAIVAYDSEIYRTTVRDDLDALARIVADNTAASLTFETPQDAQETLASLRARPNLVQACIYTEDSRLFARYVRPGGPAQCPQTVEPDSDRFTEDGLLLFRSILLNNEKIGSLYFQYELDSVIAARRRLYSGIVAGIALVSLLVALVLSARLRRLVSDPIVGLADRARTVSLTKDYGIRAEKETQDEVGLLVDAFNEMLANIQSRDAELRGAQDQLEARVRERTEELRQSEERFRAVAETANDAIVSANRKGSIVQWNKGAERTFGHPAADALGKPLTLIMPERFHMTHRQGFERYLSTREAHIVGKTVELVGRRQDESEFPLDLSLSTWETAEGVFFTAVIRDITERKHAEEALRKQATELARSNADLEQFAYVASHDLQEPLRMVTSFMQLLSNRYRGKLDADADEFIGFAVDGATRMKQLISDLLAYSRVNTSSEEPAPTDSETALLNVLTNLGLTLQESGAVVTHDTLPTFTADYSQVVQLLQNLIANAVKFRGPESPRVHVSALRTRTDWVFSVSDNGIGISPEHRERIFMIFQRLHDRITYPGTGIGLAICKRIVERHGGRIWVESTLGKGSTFFFTIPAEVPEPGKEAPREYSHDRTTTSPTTTD